MRWLSHFGFAEPPFSKEIADGELWVPSSREPLVDEVVDACTERGHVLFTGEPGVGKTSIRRAIRQRLPEAGFRLTYCQRDSWSPRLVVYPTENQERMLIDAAGEARAREPPARTTCCSPSAATA
jgi:hypothetical protein